MIDVVRCAKITLPKKNFQIPPGWRWDADWYVSPEISARYADDAGHRKFTEEVYENEYRIMAGAQWQPKAVAWTDLVNHPSVFALIDSTSRF